MQKAKAKMKRGKLILIEGTDSSGKETQTKILYERLQKEKIPVETMSFPRYDTATGRIIGQCYLGKTQASKDSELWLGDAGWFEDADKVPPEVASLYYAADRVAALPEINKIIKSGRNLILNRYVESNMAHQGGKKEGQERKKIINFINKLEYGLLQLPRPDATIFLYMPHEIALELQKARGNTTDQHEMNKAHLLRAEQTYLELAQENNWIKIDCGEDGKPRRIEDIAEEVYNSIKNIFNS